MGITWSYWVLPKCAARVFDDLPEVTALNKEYNYNGKVIIIGAGAAGLAAAKILERNNVSYEILEASDVYGGRLKKNDEFCDFPIDLSAEWIHNKAEVLNYLKGRTGSELDEQVFLWKINSCAYWTGKRFWKLSKKRLHREIDFTPQHKFQNSTWFDYIEQNFAHLVQEKITYNAKVVHVDYSGNKIVLTQDNGTKLDADKVLITVSPGILKSGNFSFKPELDKKKLKAINSKSFKPGIKLFLKFNETFYPNVFVSGSNGDFFFYDVAFGKESNDHVLGLVASDKALKKFYKMDNEQEIVNYVLKHLDDMFKDKASSAYTGNHLYLDWTHNEYSLGAWSEAIFHYSVVKEFNRPLSNKVYFAGEAADKFKLLGVPGAIMSGYYSIDKLLTE